MVRDPEAYRQDMIRAADIIRGFQRGLTRAKFETDLRTRTAIERWLGIIGEAAACFPEWARRQYPEIPWRNIVGFRQIVLHQYWLVDPDESWDAATRDAPTLAKTLRSKPLKKPSVQLEAEIQGYAGTAKQRAEILRRKK